MKKTSKKSKKITAEDREGSEQWIGLLEATYMFHMQMVKETQSPILGAEPDDEHMFHMACAQAVQDCIYLIEMVKLEGWFDDEEDLSQFRAGPAG
jgi:hypothetical protein|tara:strand:+ start:422 stop:706 length:285 start_codon:yes stop_codon:yes gene_type:complete